MNRMYLRIMRFIVSSGLFILTLLPSVHALGKPHYFGEFEYWAKGGAYQDEIDNHNQYNNFYINQGQRIDFSSEVSEGLGVRVGINGINLIKVVDLGFSISYIAGPNLDLKDREYTNPEDSSDLSGYYTNNMAKGKIYKALIEIQKSFHANKKLNFGMRGGIGLALYERINRYEDQSYYSNGSAYPYGYSKTLSPDYYAAYTWEIGPTVGYKFGKVQLNMGIVYSYFSTFKDVAVDSKFIWKPVGLRLGVEF